MADVFTGATIVFGTSSFSAEILGATLPGATRPVIDTTHLGTTVARSKIPGDLIDWGQFEFELQFDPDNEPPLDQAAETITVTFPTPSGGLTGATWEFSGFIASYSGAFALEEKMTATVTLEISGDITWTAST